MAVIIIPYPLHLTPLDWVFVAVGVVVVFIIVSVLGWLAYRFFDRRADQKRERDFQWTISQHWPTPEEERGLSATREREERP